MGPQAQIRLARQEDLGNLPAIERSAASLYLGYAREHGLPPTPCLRTAHLLRLDEAMQEGSLWVAESPTGVIVGFALATWIDEIPHLKEVNVSPIYGRQGIGSALVKAVCHWAGATEHAALTLRTFRAVPWNQPFFERLGFVPYETWKIGSGHRDRVRTEEEAGFPSCDRITMIWRPGLIP